MVVFIINGQGEGHPEHYIPLLEISFQLTGDVWAGHGGSTDGVGGIGVTNPGRGNVYTRSKDVYTGTIVGE